MEIKVSKLTDSNLSLDVARNTVNKKMVNKMPSEQFKLKMFLSEHSPIRTMLYKIEMIDIPYYVSVHFVRHKIGVEHYVTTQRTDRTGVDRDVKLQSDLVTHIMVADAQALINMAKVRLCSHADVKTTKIMQLIKSQLNEVEPMLSKVLVESCIYRGRCFENDPCPYHESQDFKVRRLAYEMLTQV